MTAKQIFVKVLPNGSFATPHVIRHGKKDKGNFVYELAVGEIAGSKIYGVTVLELISGKYQHMSFLCQSFRTLDSAEEYIRTIGRELR